jgi:hypothetical protein
VRFELTSTVTSKIYYLEGNSSLTLLIGKTITGFHSRIHSAGVFDGRIHILGASNLISLFLAKQFSDPCRAIRNVGAKR